MPFSYLAATSAAFALLGRALRRAPVALSVLGGIVVGLGALVVAIAISPAGYGDAPGGLLGGAWISAFQSDLSANTVHGDAVLALGLVVLFLGWRGITLGREPPDLDSVHTLLKISLSLIVVVAVLSTALDGGARAQAEAAVGFLLPLAVFAGLLASALSRAALNREELRGADPRTAGGERWLGMAVALSGIVVLVALLVNALVSFGSVSAAVRRLGPVGDAINGGVDWLIQAFAALLFFIFGPLIDWLRRLSNRTPPATSTPIAQPPVTRPTPTTQPHSILPDTFVHIAQAFLLICVILLIVLVAVVILRALSGTRRGHADAGVDEEREALDGASLLQAQLRGLLDRFGRRAATQPEEALPQGSVRALYREVLQAAAGRGIGRRAPETPDEYGRRLGTTLRTALRETSPLPDLATLSEAYDEARYAEREPAEGERRTLREQATRVLRALKRVGQ